MSDFVAPSLVKTFKRLSFWQGLRENRILLGKLMFSFAVALLLVGFFFYRMLSNAWLQPVRSEMNLALNNASSRISQEFGSLNHDIRFLSSYKTILTSLLDSKEENISQAQEIFVAFMQVNPFYDQLRWIDESGWERIRVNNSSEGAYLVPADKLQNKADRYYFTEAVRETDSPVYYSPFDLNIEGGVLEMPYKPMLRVACRIMDAEGKNRGIIILNYKGKPLLDTLRALKYSPYLHINVLNAQAYWFLSTQPEDEWGFMFNKVQANLAYRDPQAWELALKGTSEPASTPTGFWKFQTVANALNPEVLWYLGIQVDSDFVRASNLQAMTLIVSLGLLLWFGTFILLTYVVTAQVQKKRDYALLLAQSKSLEESNLALNKSFQNLQKAQEEIIQAGRLSSLGMMVAGIAHELNTPLGASILTLTTLQDYVKNLPPENNDFSDYFMEGSSMILGNLDKAKGLVQNFKQLAGDRMHQELRNFNLRDLVLSLFNSTLVKIRKEVPELNISIPEDIVLISYPGILGQVLENVIQNALIHGYKDVLPGKIDISAEEKPGKVSIKIQDYGHGMDKATLEKIFDPFFTTRRGNGGLGLGLYLVHQFVSEDLGGTLRVESLENKGTIFSLSLAKELKPRN